jgi:hypothetical protein
VGTTALIEGADTPATLGFASSLNLVPSLVLCVIAWGHDIVDVALCQVAGSRCPTAAKVVPAFVGFAVVVTHLRVRSVLDDPGGYRKIRLSDVGG